MKAIALQHPEKEKEIQSKPLQKIFDSKQFDVLWNNLFIALNQERINTVEKNIKKLQKITPSNGDINPSINLIEAYITLSYIKRNLFDLTNNNIHLETSARYLENAKQKLAEINPGKSTSTSSIRTTANNPNWYLILESAIEHAKGGNYLAKGASQGNLTHAIESFRIARDKRKEVIKSFRTSCEQDSKVLNNISCGSNYLAPNLARTYYKLAEAFFIAAQNKTSIKTPEKVQSMNKIYYEARNCLLKAKRYCTLAFDTQNSMFFAKNNADFEQTKELMDKIKHHNLDTNPTAKTFMSRNSDLLNTIATTPILASNRGTFMNNSSRKRKSPDTSNLDGDTQSPLKRFKGYASNYRW